MARLLKNSFNTKKVFLKRKKMLDKIKKNTFKNFTNYLKYFLKKIFDPRLKTLLLKILWNKKHCKPTPNVIMLYLDINHIRISQTHPWNKEDLWELSSYLDGGSGPMANGRKARLISHLPCSLRTDAYQSILGLNKDSASLF